MFLKKLYSEPEGLFHPNPIIRFKDGVNFIFGKKDDASDTKDSLNGIGKSLVLDFIDFCLLSLVTPRIKLAKEQGLLEGYKVVLEFEVNEETFIIKRSVETPNKDIEFGHVGSLKTYSIEELKEVVCNLAFKNENYPGKYRDTWLRKLMPFFVKIQPPKREKFVDPIQYMIGPKLMELYIYHFYLMGIDNSLSYRNFEIQSYLNVKTPVISEIERFIQETYGVKSVDEASSEVDSIALSIKDIEGTISSFTLVTEYADVEKDANKLTEAIKELWYGNFSDRKKIERYEESFNYEGSIDVNKVERIYKDVNELLAEKVEQTLNAAIEFRENLAASRREFLEAEIVSIKSDIKKRDEEISQLENKRAQLFRFLSAKEAIKDLSEAYLMLSKKKEELSQLEGKIGIYSEFVREKAELKADSATLYSEILSFLETIKQQISDFRLVFMGVYNAIYLENKDESKFTIGPNEETDAKIKIGITFPADLSKGKNQGRTLVYDIAMLLHAIEKEINSPRFLIHDGIFDGMYKGQFVHLLSYLNELKTTKRFQYIVTLNEEGTLDDRFGHVDDLNTEKIASEAIVTLTPSVKLLGKGY